jgi:alanyl-tRNA synthetase
MKERGHAIIPSAALVPENDPTTLFTGSGMQPLIPYLMGERHPLGVRLADSQKCFRANDIEEVGDNRHTTFFEMLGNWSLGDYFKREQLRWFFEFLVDEVGLDPARIYVSVFAGDESLGIPRDDESVAIWKELFAERGIDAKDVYIGSEEDGYEVGMQGGRIFYYDAGKNWWSRSGKPANMPVGEIGGPDSEVFYDFGTAYATHPEFNDKAPHPNSDSGQFLEIGNSVFIEYIKQPDGSFTKLPQRNVDFGGGLERIAAAKNGNPDVFTVDLLAKVVADIEALSGSLYDSNNIAFRIITDHIRGAVFLIGDGIIPGNSDQSYFVRRLLRRAIRYADQIGIPGGRFKDLANSVITIYAPHYDYLEALRENICSTIAKEEEQFRKTLAAGLKELQKLFERDKDNTVHYSISGKMLFDLYQTYGFPFELSLEVIEQNSGLGSLGKLPPEFQRELSESFQQHMADHRDQSRLGAEQKFKGGLADHSEKVVQYHTATHLLLAGLRRELGTHVHQAGSNITGERLRFDVTHGDKIDADVLRRVEAFVNETIKIGGEVTIDFMAKSAAQSDPTIEASFWDRYPEEVKVYTMTTSDGTVVSRELCGGPHVNRLEEVSGVFTIVKEESSAAGIRRIKATLS